MMMSCMRSERRPDRLSLAHTVLLLVVFQFDGLAHDEIMRAVDAAQLQHVVAHRGFHEHRKIAPGRDRDRDLADVYPHDFLGPGFQRQALDVFSAHEEGGRDVVFGEQFEKRGRGFAGTVVERQRDRRPRAVAVVDGRAEHARRAAAHRVRKEPACRQDTRRSANEAAIRHSVRLRWSFPARSIETEN